MSFKPNGMGRQPKRAGNSICCCTGKKASSPDEEKGAEKTQREGEVTGG